MLSTNGLAFALSIEKRMVVKSKKKINQTESH